jgi:ribosomal protein S18 acetylase RimI-like enzyme
METYIISTANDPLLRVHSDWIMDALRSLSADEKGYTTGGNIYMSMDLTSGTFDNRKTAYRSAVDLIGWDSEERAGKVFLLTIIDDEPVGVMSITNTADSVDWVISSFYVATEHRNKGIGSRMVNKAKDLVIEYGANRLALNVFMENVRAKGLYDHLGFKTVLVFR